jgi:hypothetical protein
VAEWRGGFRTVPIERLALRSLAVGLLVLAVCFSNLGPAPIGRGLATLMGRPQAPPPRPRVQVAAAGARSSHHELESFIPADASLVVALSDSAVLQQVLTSSGLDAGSKLAALEKCQIGVPGARMILAARKDQATRMVVLRAAGVTDPRNLYCLVGILGSDRLKLRFLSDKPPVRFEVEGLTARSLKFEAVDEQTVVAVEGGWQGGPIKKLFSPDGLTEEPPLAAALARVDRGASLWSATAADTGKGHWDLALDARAEGLSYKVRGSSVPPSGEAEKAELEMHLPLAFASALPAAALEQGLRSVVAAVAAMGSPPPTAARP